MAASPQQAWEEALEAVQGLKLCLACREPVWLTFPEDVDGPLPEAHEDWCRFARPHEGTCTEALFAAVVAAHEPGGDDLLESGS
jgi:hypothetical protein